MLPGLIILLVVFTLVLMAPLSLEMNTLEQNYSVTLAWFFRIRYECCQYQRGLRFFLFGCSWFQRFRWPITKKKKVKKRKKPKKTKEKQLGLLLLTEREVLWGVLLKVRDSWCDLQRLSGRRWEINLCTPDFMANALLGLVLANREARGIQIRVNYQEENWVIGYFTIRLGVFLWIAIKFIFSRPVSKLGFRIIHSKLRGSIP